MNCCSKHLKAQTQSYPDLDCGLQELFRWPAEEWRVNFFALHLTAPDTFHYDPDRENYQELRHFYAKKRPVTDFQKPKIPTSEVQETHIRDAILQYHEPTFLLHPNFSLEAREARKQFYTHTIFEQCNTNPAVRSRTLHIRILDPEPFTNRRHQTCYLLRQTCPGLA